LIGEAYLQIHDAEAGSHIEKRMRRYGEKLNTRTGLGWLAAYEGVRVWYSGDIERGVVLMRKAAEDLEAVPMIFDAARLRRQLAGRLADLGKKDEALQELRRVHEVFQRIGAQPELKKTRGMFGELDTRPPSISKGTGAAALSQRELEIARLVAGRKSNKAIAKELGISPRTVSTHLSNTFQKLEIGSRGELADYAREHDLLSGDAGG
jgi:DNA-binding CsgD family transcriptional regulator